MTTDRLCFPVRLFDRDLALYPRCPSTIPWKLVEKHRGFIERQFGQPLEQLAECDMNGRSGLDPIELVSSLDGRHWASALAHQSYQEAYSQAVDRLCSIAKRRNGPLIVQRGR